MVYHLLEIKIFQGKKNWPSTGKKSSRKPFGNFDIKSLMNKLLNYFDLRINNQPAYEMKGKQPAVFKKQHWAPQYLALFAGIIVQPFLQQYLNTGRWDLKGFGSWVIAGIFIGIMALPAVYKNAFDNTKPIFVQFCVIFISGMGWQSLVTVVKQATAG